ncbi:MAG TPA: hypothetical protein VMH82_08725 [Myxococcota bacterium]|nr:hypothetical protein [Myxococcota bacterium]
MRPIAFAGLTALALGAPLVARADCLSDCGDSYEAAMTACHQSNPDPGQLDQLQMCMDQAQQAFEACEQQCESSSN